MNIDHLLCVEKNEIRLYPPDGHAVELVIPYIDERGWLKYIQNDGLPRGVL